MLRYKLSSGDYFFFTHRQRSGINFEELLFVRFENQSHLYFKGYFYLLRASITARAHFRNEYYNNCTYCNLYFLTLFICKTYILIYFCWDLHELESGIFFLSSFLSEINSQIRNRAEVLIRAVNKIVFRKNKRKQHQFTLQISYLDWLEKSRTQS